MNYLHETAQNPEVEGLKAALRLKEIDLCRAKLESAYNLNNYAGLLIEKWQTRLKQAQAVSEGK